MTPAVSKEAHEIDACCGASKKERRAKTGSPATIWKPLLGGYWKRFCRAVEKRQMSDRLQHWQQKLDSQSLQAVMMSSWHGLLFDKRWTCFTLRNSWKWPLAVTYSSSHCILNLPDRQVIQRSVQTTTKVLYDGHNCASEGFLFYFIADHIKSVSKPIWLQATHNMLEELGKFAGLEENCAPMSGENENINAQSDAFFIKRNAALDDSWFSQYWFWARESHSKVVCFSTYDYSACGLPLEWKQ